MRIAFLGLGQMGSSLARLLVEKGHEVTVWNRSAAAARPLAELGAKVADTPVDAVRDAEAVLTMVHDDAALESILFEQGTLAAMPADAVHVSLSTISVALAERLEQEHADHKQRYLGAPVFGRPNVAAEGKLWLAIAGAAEVRDAMQPVLAVFSRGVTVIGDQPRQAHAIKVAGNFMITAMIAAMAEGFTFTEAHGLDPALFHQTIQSALFQSPLYESYGKVMLTPPEKPGATVSLGVKDTRLFREAAKEVEMRTPLADVFQQVLNAAAQGGGGEQDWAAGYLAQVRSEAKGLV